MASVEFFYEGSSLTVQCNKNDRMKYIFQQFINKANINPNSVAFLYNGTIINNKELTFNELSNSDDKYRNKMNIIVTNSSQSSSLKFEFGNFKGFDEQMKDYAKMSILLAFQEAPDDGAERCGIIAIKFEERYGGEWACVIYEVGSGNLFFRTSNYLAVKYREYKIVIFKTK